MEITFLGTSCAVPTKDRGHSTFYLDYKGEGILFDCGENSQRQLKIAGIKPAKITKVLISHWHGDHVFGLPGLIYTLGMGEYNKTLKIYGPPGTKKYLATMLDSTVDAVRIKIEVNEVGEGVFYEGKWFRLEAAKLEHRCPTLGFAFVEKDRRRIDVKYTKKAGIPEGPLLGRLQEGKSVTWKGKKINAKDATYVVKGKKLVYIADTLPCRGANKIAKNADLLIVASTYTSKDKDKAEKHLHLTAQQAGLIASKSNVKQLVLTHFSTRYKNIHDLEQDARDVFDNSFAAKDFMKIEL
jgi:ribonuclease Z